MPKRVLIHRKKINVTLHPDTIKKLDLYAAELKVTRSGLIEYMCDSMHALESNKKLVSLIEAMIKRALKGQ